MRPGRIKKSAEEIWKRPGVTDPNRIIIWVDKETLTEKQKYYDEGGGLLRLKMPKVRPKKAERK